MLPSLPRSTTKHLITLIRSMRFAISLLVVLAIASIIGTVLKQGEPYNAYLNQLGGFWFRIFEFLGLYNVYNSSWFLLILTFLVISVTLCIVQQTPGIFRVLLGYRTHISESSLLHFRHHREIPRPTPFSKQANEHINHHLSAWLKKNHWRYKIIQRHDNDWLISAKRGSTNKLGYLLAHSAIVLICLGGLIDGNLPLKLQLMLSSKTPLKTTHNDTSFSEKNHLGLSNPSFRGTTFVPEGASRDQTLLRIGDGTLLQDLPFSLTLKKFTIEHYPTGQPKRFLSQVDIVEKKTNRHYERTIEVNKPLYVDGITIYQSSFGDGGSHLNVRMRTIDKPTTTRPVTFSLDNGFSTSLHTKGYPYSLEITDFRPFNIENLSEATPRPHKNAQDLWKRFALTSPHSETKNLVNVGPSITYKLRDTSGQATEFNTYMSPITLGLSRFYMVGMRDNPNTGFSYWRIPVDADNSIDTFLTLRAFLINPKNHALLTSQFSNKALPKAQSELRQRMETIGPHLLQLFSQQGFEAVSEFIEQNVPPEGRSAVAEIYLTMLQGMAWEAYQNILTHQTKHPQLSAEEQGRFVQNVLLSISDSFQLPAPIFFQLINYQEVRASIFQMTKSPGKFWVFLGALCLALGVFAMLYIRERRAWWLIQPHRVLLAYTATHNNPLAEQEFSILAMQSDTIVQQSSSRS